MRGRTRDGREMEVRWKGKRWRKYDEGVGVDVGDKGLRGYINSKALKYL